MTSLDQDVLARLRENMSSVRAPSAHDKVYKDECLYTFDSPYSPNGLYVNLSTWGGVSRDFLDFDSSRTDSKLYLQLIYSKVSIDEDGKNEDKAKETVLGIGVAGGFKTDSQRFETVKDHYLVLVRDDGGPTTIQWPNPDIPEFIRIACQAVIDHAGVVSQSEEAAWLADDPRPISKYAEHLVQLSNGVRITNDASTWKCAESGRTENLWLNLSTGHIGSGRPQLVGDRMIGTGAALRHFEATGRAYPLVVKLGTITSHGADVYSYAPDEDCMVTDPALAEHLAHWGIEAMKLEKTDKSLAELEIDSQRWAFSRITESGASLKPLHGAGYVGLKNLGNSCYMNAVVQILFTLPEMQEHYYDSFEQLVQQRAVNDPAEDVLTQTAKLALGLCSERYAHPDRSQAFLQQGEKPEEEMAAIEPRMFKQLVGKGHSEFSSGRQQDAAEYLHYLMAVLIRAERTGMPDGFMTESLFRYQVEERLQCAESKQVRYKTTSATALLLDIPVAQATNKAAVAAYQDRKQKRQRLPEPSPVSSGGPIAQGPAKLNAEEPEVLPVVPFDACLQCFRNPAMIEDWYSSALGRRSVASKTVRFQTFPRYLIVKMMRYYVDQAWHAQKLEALVELPEELDLTMFRAQGPQRDETPLPDDPEQSRESPSGNTTVSQPDPLLAEQMAPFGFTGNAIGRALIAVNNSSVEAATNWIFEHSNDADLNDPVPGLSGAGGGTGGGKGLAAGSNVRPEDVANLASMLGFTEDQARAALIATGSSMDRAADWLFSHMDDLASAVAEALGQDQVRQREELQEQVEYDDGEGKYELIGFISHIGRNTASGHYLAHIKKGGRWVIFDDQKVAASEKPPCELGYVYLYGRIDRMESRNVQ